MKQNIFSTIGSITLSVGMFAASLGIFTFTSCQKSNNNPNKATTPTITAADSVALGYWFGSFDGNINQSMLFTSNGVVKVYDFYYHPTSTDTTIAYDGTGYWSVSGNQLTVVDSFPNGEKFTSVNTLNLTANPETFTDNTGSVYTKQ